MDDTHADNHDRDKLTRWHEGLIGIGDSLTPIDRFPAFAVFLVGPDDVSAHNVFRSFRSKFESGGAGFDNLVIFGQHGHSKALASLMSELGLEQQPLPLLTLFTSQTASAMYTLPLSSGGTEDIGSQGQASAVERCEDVLSQIVEAAGTGTPNLDLSGAAGVTTTVLTGGPLVGLVERALRRIS